MGFMCDEEASNQVIEGGQEWAEDVGIVVASLVLEHLPEPVAYRGLVGNKGIYSLYTSLLYICV